MRATVMYGAGDVRIEDVPDAQLDRADRRARRGHPRRHLRQRPLAVQVDGAERRPAADGPRVHRRRRGRRRRRPDGQGRRPRRDRRSRGPTAPACSARRACRRLPPRRQCSATTTSTAAQAEAVRVPQADGTLVVLPVGQDDALMPSLLTLSDVMGTGHHAAVAAGGRPREDRGRCRRRRRRPVRRDRGEAARRRADHHPRPSSPTGSRSRRSSARPTSSASAATRRSSACAS